MIRYSPNGGFNDMFLHVKYPDFAGGRLEASHAGRGHDRDNSLAFEVVACSSGISSANMSKCQNSDWPASNSTFAVPVIGKGGGGGRW